MWVGVAGMMKLTAPRPQLLVLFIVQCVSAQVLLLQARCQADECAGEAGGVRQAAAAAAERGCGEQQLTVMAGSNVSWQFAALLLPWALLVVQHSIVPLARRQHFEACN